MRKIWGLAVFSLCHTAAFANTNIVAAQCKDYMRPASWKPVADLPQGAIDIVANDVELQGVDSAEFSGNVVINSKTMSLEAKRALIDKKEGLLSASGPLLYRDKFTKVNSNGLFADLNANTISLLGAEYELTEQRGRGGAEKLYAADNQISLQNSSFTTCPSTEPFWQIEASNIVLSREDGWGKTYNTVFKIMDTPVIYLPYFTFPIDDRRKSGLLTPTISSSNKFGLELITPYYLNIAPNYDATFSPRYMANKGLQLITEFRYLTEQHRGKVAVEYLHKDDSEPQLDERYLVNWQQKSYLSEQWRAYVDITNVSDDNYLTDLSSDYANDTDTQLYRTASLSYLGESWLIDMKLQDFEVLGDHVESYTALPQIRFSTRDGYEMLGLDWNFDGEFAHFKNDSLTITDATRLHLEPRVSFSRNEYAWSFTSEARLLHTRYQQEGDFINSDYQKSVSRTLPSVRLHGQLNFERNTAFFFDEGTQTLEPQLQYLYTPHREQSQIGWYDTTKLQDDFVGLFRARRYSGYDRIAQANQFTLGATTRIYDDTNVERFNFSAGQIIYLESSVKPTAQLLSDETNYNALFAAETMLHWHKRWYLSGGVQYDADSKELVQSHFTLDYKGDDNQLVQLNHRYVNEVSDYEIDQVGLFTSLPIDENWQFVASYHRDMTADRSVESFVGIQYQSCCWAIQLTANRQIETDLNQTLNHDEAVFDSGFSLKFVLSGLGSQSSGDASKLLQQGIFGYRRPYFLNK
ncbi:MULTISPECIES: LPS assembly protein LptD [unclassified Pseudoalteromonas]|uniref:LPS assembly protein LptD n=1 Tax=unclassified Pseudoalteromonas TaxID=194690 RepID=UPI003014C35A